MSGKKNYAVTTVITGLTSTQAANLHRDILKAKNKNAPKARGTASIGTIEDVSHLLQGGFKAITKKK